PAQGRAGEGGLWPRRFDGVGLGVAELGPVFVARRQRRFARRAEREERLGEIEPRRGLLHELADDAFVQAHRREIGLGQGPGGREEVAGGEQAVLERAVGGGGVG